MRQIIFYHSTLVCLIGCLEVINSSVVFSTCIDSHSYKVFKHIFFNIVWFSTFYKVCYRYIFFQCRELSWWILQMVFSLITGCFCMHPLSSCSPLHSYELKEPSTITKPSTDTRSCGHALMVPWLWKVSFEKLCERSLVESAHPNGGSPFYCVDGFPEYGPFLRQYLQ